MAKTGLTYEMLCEEVLAQLIGKRCADLLAKETDQTVVGKIKEWIGQYWKTFAGAIGLRDITELEASAMTIERGKGPSKFLEIPAELRAALGMASVNFFTARYLTPLAKAGYIAVAGGEKNRYLPGKRYKLLRKGKAVFCV